MSEDNDSLQHEFDTTANGINADNTLSQLINMLPRVLASDERDARRYALLQRQWRHMPFSGSEIEEELRNLLINLQKHLKQSSEGLSKVLSTPTQALLYIERATFYALQDYPQNVENHPNVKQIWLLLNSIQRVVRAWFRGETHDNGEALILAIQNSIEEAIHGVFRDFDQNQGHSEDDHEAHT